MDREALDKKLGKGFKSPGKLYSRKEAADSKSVSQA